VAGADLGRKQCGWGQVQAIEVYGVGAGKISQILAGSGRF